MTSRGNQGKLVSGNILSICQITHHLASAPADTRHNRRGANANWIELKSVFTNFKIVVSLMYLDLMIRPARVRCLDRFYFCGRVIYVNSYLYFDTDVVIQSYNRIKLIFLR